MTTRTSTARRTIGVAVAGDGAGFAVVPEALATHATSVDHVAQTVDQGREAGEHVRMGRMAYGLLCQMIPTLIDPLQEAAVTAARDSADSLRSTAAELRTTAQRYEESETGAGDLFGGFPR